MKKEEKFVLEETLQTIFNVEHNEQIRLCLSYFHKSIFGGCHSTLCEDEIYLKLNNEGKYWLVDEFNEKMQVATNSIKKLDGTLHIRCDKTDHNIIIQYLYDNKVEITLCTQKHSSFLGYDYQFRCSLTTIKKLLKKYATMY